MREDRALARAEWLAREVDGFGAYAVAIDGARDLFLDLETLDGENGHAVHGMVYAFFYRASDACASVIAVAAHVGVCSDCVHDLGEVALLDRSPEGLAAAAENATDVDEAIDTHPTTPCVACGGYGERIFGDEASLCDACLAACRGAFAGH